MENYVIWLLGLPIVFFLASISYQIINLFYLWLKFKLENIKNKEYSLWD